MQYHPEEEGEQMFDEEEEEGPGGLEISLLMETKKMIQKLIHESVLNTNLQISKCSQPADKVQVQMNVNNLKGSGSDTNLHSSSSNENNRPTGFYDHKRRHIEKIITFYKILYDRLWSEQMMEKNQ